MPTASKSKPTFPAFSPAQIAAAKAAAPPASRRSRRVEWDKGVVTPGGGVAATIASVRRVRGPNKRPTKEQVAIRLDREIVGAFRAGGPGWQTRLNDALKEWLATRSGKRRQRRSITVR
ncbi:MAG: BrnA antitoxin family protein [Burkholderiaceae bacterium]|nr:BrnA antitoxin family protein [Burkholderiaceae bacterium]